MQPETRAMTKIDKLMQGLLPEQRRSVAFYVHRTYGGAMSSTERSQRFRSRQSNESVAPTVASERNESVSLDSVVGLVVPVSSNGDHGSKEAKSDALEVLKFLNEKTGRRYRPVRVNLDFIEARLKSGATLADCRGIIVRKAREWKGTNIEKYLRPATLFNREKFEQYIGEQGT